MATYVTATDCENYIEGLVIDDADLFEELMLRAERDVDNVLGPIPQRTVAPAAGLKLDPAALADWEAEALARAVAAQVQWRLERGKSLGTRPAKLIQGPDFKEEYDNPGTGLYSPRVALELRPIAHLRRLTARSGSTPI